MKNLTRILIVIACALFYACGPVINPMGVAEEKFLPGKYVVIVNDRYDTSEKIIEYANKKGIKLSEDQVFSEGLNGFSAELTREQYAKLDRWFSGAKEIQPDFTIQSQRPRIQTEPFIQSQRPRIQEWHFDTTRQTNDAIIYIGGPNPNPTSTAKVWIVDTGIDSTHQDLKDQLVRNGLQKSYVASEQDPYKDGNGHGTFCAGLIGAKSTDPTDSLVHFNGVSPGAKMVSVKVMNSNGDGNWGDVLRGFLYSVKNSEAGDIISMSLGAKEIDACNYFNSSKRQKLKNKIKQKGIYVVMSAGNADSTGVQMSSTENFMGCVEGESFVTVGSLTLDASQTATFSDFSYYGMPSIDFVTPGSEIFSTYKDNQYIMMSGTSASCAIMAGIIHANGGIPNPTRTVTGGPGDLTYPIGEIE
jgi:hypothetical protein